MRCIDFRRQALTDPSDPGADALEHAHACAGCARYLYSLRLHEATCRRALAVEAPAGLADRVLLRHSAQRSKARTPMPLGLPLAAALALFVAAVLAVSPLVERGHAPRGSVSDTTFVAHDSAHAMVAGLSMPDAILAAPVQGGDSPVALPDVPLFVGACSMPAPGNPGAALPWSRSLLGPGTGPLWSCPDCM